jgi:hypothetical protein
MVAQLGVDLALRTYSKVKKRLAEHAASLSHNRDSDNPSCFRFRFRLVERSKGGSHECAFLVDDQTPDELRVVGFVSEFRPIGPI